MCPPAVTAVPFPSQGSHSTLAAQLAVFYVRGGAVIIRDSVTNEEEGSVQDDTEVLRNLDWHTEINIHHQRLQEQESEGYPWGQVGRQFMSGTRWCC